MKALACASAPLMILVLLMLPGRVYAFDPRQDDKQKHMAASFALSSAVYAAARSQDRSRLEASIMAVGFTLLVGHSKEHSDSFYDSEDMQANTFGAVLAPILWLEF